MLRPIRSVPDLRLPGGPAADPTSSDSLIRLFCMRSTVLRRSLLDGQDIRKARDPEELHDRLVPAATLFSIALFYIIYNIPALTFS